ncbi:MAG TPA: DUF1631 family protein [Xanthomonadaceae bacterium]|nr:DUF1631 family protein [Xanthomonadaceae bacterium]
MADKVLEAIGPGLCRTFDRADEVMFDLACAAGNDQGQHRYFDGMRLLRLRRGVIIERFREQVAAAWRVQSTMRAAGARQAATPDGMALELVSEEELEQRLAIDGIVARSEVAMGLALAELQACLSARLGRGLNAVDCAIGPRGLAEAMRDALGPVDVSLKARLVLLECFECEVLGALPETYRRVTEFLSIGSPLLRRSEPDGHRRVPHAVGAGPQQATSATAGTVGAAASPGRARIAPAVVPVRGSGAGRMAVSTSRSGAARANVDSGPERAEAADVETTRTLVVADAVQRLFETSGMVFDEAPQLEAAIGRLQVPVIRVAMAQPALFSDAEHPVRRFLTELARWTRRWGRHPPSDAILLKRLGAVHALAEGDIHARLGFFDAEARFMERSAAEQLRRAQLVERRAREAAQGKARLADAEGKVAELVSGWPELLQLPAELGELALSRWPRYLVLLSLRHGPTGLPWHEAVSLLADLAASVAGRGPQALDANVLTRGVLATGGHRDEVDRYCRVFQAWRTRPAPGHDRSRIHQPLRGDDCAVGHEPPVLDLDDLLPGRVFDMVQDDGRPCRIKLSWIGKQGARYLFVDGRGLKCVELDRKTVLAMLAAGRILPVDFDTRSRSAVGAA